MANGHGGKRDNSGRKKTVATETWKGPTLPDGQKLRPLDLFLAVLRDPSAPIDARMQAAKEAMPYMHAKPAPARDGEQIDLANAPGAGDDWTHDLDPRNAEGGVH